jgi:hypothetical protein
VIDAQSRLSAVAGYITEKTTLTVPNRFSIRSQTAFEFKKQKNQSIAHRTVRIGKGRIGSSFVSRVICLFQRRSRGDVEERVWSSGNRLWSAAKAPDKDA